MNYDIVSACALAWGFLKATASTLLASLRGALCGAWRPLWARLKPAIRQLSQSSYPAYLSTLLAVSCTFGFAHFLMRACEGLREAWDDTFDGIGLSRDHWEKRVRKTSDRG